MHLRTLTSLAVTAVVAALLAGCGSIAPASPQPSEPTLDQPGKHLVRYLGPKLEVLVDYQFAAASLGQEWMILNVAVGGSQAAATEVRSDAVTLRIPDGTRIPLPSYEAFASAFPEIQSASRRAALAASPLDFTRADRSSCLLSFQPVPGTVPVLTSVYVTLRRLCSGLLYFPVPGGIQPGRYALAIGLEEGEVVVPFEIGAD